MPRTSKGGVYSLLKRHPDRMKRLFSLLLLMHTPLALGALKLDLDELVYVIFASLSFLCVLPLVNLMPKESLEPNNAAPGCLMLVALIFLLAISIGVFSTIPPDAVQKKYVFSGAFTLTTAIAGIWMISLQDTHVRHNRK